LTQTLQKATIATMLSKVILWSRLAAVFTLLTGIFLLSACGIPDWIIDLDEDSDDVTAEAYPPIMEIAVTGTPIDAVAYASPTPLSFLQTPGNETPSPVFITVTPEEVETAVERCTDPETGSSLTYDEAFDIAADSPCTAEGNLLPAHTCNESSGTWWIGLDAVKEGCNPACVVGANGFPAEINWRCTGATGGSQADQVVEKFSDWRGTIQRQPQGSQVEFRFVHDDGRLFNIDAKDNDIRQQFPIVAWTASNVLISGVVTAVPDLLLVEDLTVFLTKNSEPRNLSPFSSPSSSSQLAADEGGIYFAAAAIDGLESQPWCEGVEGDGRGEWIQLDFTSPAEITSLRLSNGYQGGGYLYEINGRVKTLAFYVDGELVDNWSLVDSIDQQEYNLAGDVVPGIVANSLKLVIEETYPGWEFEDTCIGEIEVWGRPAE
jgi:hypothetical protein